MKTLVSSKPLTSIETPLLALIVAQGSPSLIDASLERPIASGDYKGKKDETLLVYGGGKAQRILLVGVGKAAEVTRSSVRRAAAIAAKRARSLGTKAFALAVAKEARKAWLMARHHPALAAAEKRAAYDLINPLIATENALLRAKKASA